MSAENQPPTSPLVSPVPRSRARFRLLMLAAVVALWLMDWMQVQITQGGTVMASGAEFAGPIAATTLVVLFGLAAASLIASTLRGLRAGMAFADAGLACAVAYLMASQHPWMPGGEIRTLWAAIFAPLAALAFVDGLSQRFARDPGPELAALRAGAAFFAAGTLFVDSAYVPAGIALFLSLSALLALRTKRAISARRAVEGLLLLAALGHGAAPSLQRWIEPVGTRVQPAYLWFWLWGVATVLVVLTALDGLMRPESETLDVAAA